ncbi:glutathione S-transferase L3 [Citrus clementina]|uniref:glutathione S-transferase L3 n=1 Tax=Citrus clementina TaxID=85681 RepID=UPI000CECF7F3|nr:glutathione S-transferase L3 [Citrus x clementina]
MLVICAEEFLNKIGMSSSLQVPALEHNGKVIGESLDLIKYVDSNFEGPSLLPDDPEKRKFADELFSHIDTFTNDVYTSFKGDPAKQAGPAFDYLEKALDKFDDGPFFLGQTTRQ